MRIQVSACQGIGYIHAYPTAVATVTSAGADGSGRRAVIPMRRMSHVEHMLLRLDNFRNIHQSNLVLKAPRDSEIVCTSALQVSWRPTPPNLAAGAAPTIE